MIKGREFSPALSYRVSVPTASVPWDRGCWTMRATNLFPEHSQVTIRQASGVQ